MALVSTIYLAESEAVTAEQTHASTQSTAGVESSGGLGAIGIDGKALMFQIINFVILFFILKKVAYKPILGLLEERRKRIDESLKLADETTEAHAKAEAEMVKLLAKARSKAETIAARTRDEAAELLKSAETRANVRAEQIEKDAAERMAR